MVRKIKAEDNGTLDLIDGKVKKIFETRARKCGNGAIIYVPKKNIDDRFYVIILDDMNTQ